VNSLAARATVHFNVICEHFAPYNTTFSIAAAKELKDTKLSAACSLHAASGSTSSSTSSLRRRRLMEIAEEEEEEQRASKRQSIVHEDRPKSAIEPEVQSPLTASSSIPVTLNAELATSPEHSNFAGTSEPPSFLGVPRPSSPAKSFDDLRRMSSQSSRPDIFSYSSYQSGKPKVKLGPRPSLDVSGRPRTAAGNFRPISTIPAGFKLFSKGSKKGKSNSSESTPHDEIPEIAFIASSIPIPEAPPIPQDELPRPHTSGGRPTTSSGISIKSIMPVLTSTAKQVMTPEKARLMKAMKLREQKKKLSMMPPPPVPVPIISPPDEDEAPEQVVVAAEPIPPPVEIPEENEHNLRTYDADTDRRRSMSKADSGIVLDVSSSTVHTDQASEMTQTDSRPASPIIASSEPDQSTKASSLSESTDETVQANNLLKEEQDGVREHIIQEPLDSGVPAAKILTPEESPVLPREDCQDYQQSPVAKEEKEGEIMSQEQEVLDRGSRHITPTNDEPETAEPEVEVPRVASVSIPISKFATNIPAADRESPLYMDWQDVDTEILPPTKPEEVVAAAVEVQVEQKSEDVPRPTTLRIPKSKFSTQDLRAAAATPPVVEETPPVPSVPNPSLPEPSLPETALPEPILEDNKSRKSLSIQEKASEADTSSLHSRRSKRRAFIEPIRTDLPDKRVSRSDADFSDDDEDLMDELQLATLQEAKPMTVSKSPITPVLPSPSKNTPNQSGVTTPHAVRTVSNPIRGSLLTPADVSQSSARSISSGAAFLHKITQQASSQNLTPKTGKIGSSISQRIKALEKLSGGAVSAPDAPPRNMAPSSTFFSVRKSSIREPSRSPSVAERANSFTKNSPPSTNQSRESSPEASKNPPRDRSGSVASRLSMFEPAGGNSTPRGRQESIQVTARIVRDPNVPFPRMPEIRKEVAEFSTLDLKQSPLVVDHQKAEPAPMPMSTPAVVDTPKETIQERRASKEKRRSQSQDRSTEGKEIKRRSSLSIVRDFIKERRKSLTSPSMDTLAAPSPFTPSRSPSRPPSTHTNTAFPRRLSISSRRSSISKETVSGAALSPSLYTETSGSGDEGKPASGEKKKSRAGRFIRRLSSSLGGGRGKNLTPGISPTVQEEEAAEVALTISSGSRGSTSQQPTIIAYMGDVNVQFPDNLLWKRRSLCIDSQGFLILSAIAATAAPKDKQPAGAGVKRYHLSEFRPPYTPEMEVQELPNSVCLDFVDGSGLQIACEDRAGQLNVLHSKFLVSPFPCQ
jgi:hypothetical protein